MPLVHVIAGPNGAGKTTFFEQILGPATHLRFINADRIAQSVWPGREERHAYQAAARAEVERLHALQARVSFVAETVFSHPSKLQFLRLAGRAGYQVTLHVIMVPEELAVVRARLRHEQGGHSVPEAKVRSRFRRVWPLLRKAIGMVDESILYDNSRARSPFRIVARYRSGTRVLLRRVPTWAPLS